MDYKARANEIVTLPAKPPARSNKDYKNVIVGKAKQSLRKGWIAAPFGFAMTVLK